ncbi:branched-chain amino acid ABC transporter permease [Gemmatimonadota bacterium]
MDSLLNALSYGAVAGAIYASVALGYALIYSILGFVNFAHGDLLAVGAYLCWFLGSAVLGLPLVLCILIAAIGTGLISLCLGKFVLVPARTRSTMTALVAAIGLSLAIQSVVSLVFTPDAKAFYSGLAISTGNPVLSFTPLHLTILVGTLGALAVTWFLFFKRSSLGIEIRACASNPTAARILGLRRGRAFGIVFFLSGVLAGIAGIAKGLDDQIIVPTMGFALGIRAFIASVIGGVKNFKGAIGGAFVLGMLENLAIFLVLSVPQFGILAAVVSKDTIALIVLTGVLLWRPQGVFDRKVESRP